MRVVEDVSQVNSSFPHLVLTIGSFDGVHLGHRRILDEVTRSARTAGGSAAVLTLRPHPRQVFSPDHAPNLLTSESHKLRLIEEAGMDVVFFLPFGGEVAGMNRMDFLRCIILEHCGAREVVVGHDFRFGKDASGDYHFLCAQSAQCGLVVRQVPPLFIDGERVSSTLIREQILQGDLERAGAFLGRRFSMVGVVTPGRGIGAQLGFPTANIRPGDLVTPAQGVYVAEVRVGPRRYKAAVNIGVAPTIRHEDTILEAHLLGFSGNLEGQEIEVVFLKRLRPEKKFPSHDALMEQIGRDIEAVRTHFAETAE